MNRFKINRIFAKNLLISIAVALTTTAQGFTAIVSSEEALFAVSSYGDQSVIENNAYTSPSASLTGSPSGTVIYSLSGFDESLFTINTSTGVVSMVARDYENPMDIDANNLYSVVVTASDSASNTASTRLDVVVFNDCSSSDSPSIFMLSSPDSLGDLSGNTASLRVSLMGSGGIPLQGVAVTLVRTSGSATVTAASGSTGAGGTYISSVTGSNLGVSLFTAMYDSTGDGTPDAMVTIGSPTSIQFTSDVSNFAIRGLVGIGTENPDASTVLEIAGTEKGVLVPRVPLGSAADTATIIAPALSLLVYNTLQSASLDVGFVFWDGSGWKNVCTR
jgi:hypothetical protein